MSVLSKIVRERAEWSNQQKVIAERHYHAKILLEYITLTILCILPCLVYAYRDKIGMIVHKLFN